MILFVDDDPIRHGVFELHGSSAGMPIWHVWNCEQAILALDTISRFEIIHLDHDLSDYDEERQRNERNGFDVAVHLTTLDKNRHPTRVIIHSHNPTGAEKIRVVLDAAGIATEITPFVVK
jgi:CheY-like chemotaxis protein